MVLNSLNIIPITGLLKKLTFLLQNTYFVKGNKAF